jgi:agmatine deiminase
MTRLRNIKIDLRIWRSVMASFIVLILSTSGAISYPYHPSNRLPAEFEPVRGIVVTWPVAFQQHWITYVALVREIVKHEQAVIIVPDEITEASVRAYLQKSNIDQASNIIFWHLPTDSIWIRDYGPIYTISDDDKPTLVIVNTQYAPLERPILLSDDDLPIAVMQLQPYRLQNLDLIVEGGNILSDGQGRCFSTTILLARNAQLDQQEIRDRLNQALGCRDLVVLPSLLGESTGHVGLFLRLFNVHTAVVGRCESKQDENCSFLDQVAHNLSTMRASDGLRYQIIRVPYPWVGVDGKARLYASYVNSIILNSTLLVPVFGLPEDTIALDNYRTALPQYRIVPVASDSLLYSAGALQCISLPIPYVPETRNAL